MQNRIYYHSTTSANRASISADGLLDRRDRTGYGAVFLTDTPPKPRAGFDVWLVDAAGLNLEPDCTGDPDEGNWFMFYGSIGADRLILEKIRLNVMATSNTYHGAQLYRVVHQVSGEESALYTLEEAIGIVRLAQLGELRGSFLAGVTV
ncbi:hypothetical protein [Cupriavidus sp. TMH.W2]|uniref:hypothetical protein n=1 Tax=Cupriavidus sp. TMH.W2 TaxID=3434465 RepID=UPI003D773106